MQLFEKIKSNVTDAVDSLVEKNRLHAQLTRLRFVMRTEHEIMNKNFVALGKYYYENLMEEDANRDEEIIASLENAKIKIEKAKERYRCLIEQKQSREYEEECAELEDITVACSNESEYDGLPLPFTVDLPDDEPEAGEIMMPAQKAVKPELSNMPDDEDSEAAE